jgi:hypothetical protein
LKVHRLLAKDSKRFTAAVFQKIQITIACSGDFQIPSTTLQITYEQRA